MTRPARYPRHLARHVASRLAEREGWRPPERVLRSLFEILYFASLKTDEDRPRRFTINFVAPPAVEPGPPGKAAPDCSVCVPFERSLNFDVRTLAKLADAVDPTVSSLAVFCDGDGRLFVWGLVDQEPRYADYASLDSSAIPPRPGLFQATIHGVGNISVYDSHSLVGSLEQGSLVRQYHDVIWSGPVHDFLKNRVRQTYERFAAVERPSSRGQPWDGKESLTRWLNAVSRILLNIQRYRHGGGLIISSATSFGAVNVKYRLRYDRLPRSLADLARHRTAGNCIQHEIGHQCHTPVKGSVPCRMYQSIVAHRNQLEASKNEVLSCIRFIASLSRVDGFVLLDNSLVVHGFGTELRQDSALSEICIAGDSRAHARWMRTARLEEYGTRHRAVMRYCYETPGTLGFVVSQDGDIRATLRLRDKLVLWENVNAQRAYRVEAKVAVTTVPLCTTQPLDEVA